MFNLKTLSFFSIITIILIGLIFYVNNLENNTIKEDENSKNNFIKFLKVPASRNTIIAGALVFVIGLKTRDLINSLLETIIFPIFDVDMNHNGIPDYQEISKIINFTIFGISFNFGFFFLNIIKYLLFIVIVYLLIQVISKKTNLINLDVN